MTPQIRAFAVVLSVLLTAGCELLGMYDDAGSDRLMAATPDAPFELAAGHAAVVDGATLRFANVAEDSRCPLNVMCFWEGRVRLVFSLTAGRATTTFTVEGFIGGERGDRALERDVDGYRITVHALAPYPVDDPKTGSERGTPTALVSVVKLGA